MVRRRTPMSCRARERGLPARSFQEMRRSPTQTSLAGTMPPKAWRASRFGSRTRPRCAHCGPEQADPEGVDLHQLRQQTRST